MQEYVVIALTCALCAHLVNCQEGSSPCGAPQVPINARYRYSNQGLNADYQCDSGYELLGSSGSLVCDQIEKKWRGDIPFCGVNVALHRPANQSSEARGGSARYANDGQSSSANTAGADRKCSETLKEPAPWWSVDLLMPYEIRLVRIATRGCCGQQPLQDLEIRVGNSSTDLQRNPLCAWYPGTVEEGVTKSFTCARPVVGRFVAVQLVGSQASLSLCEVEVFTADEFSGDACAPKGASASLEIVSFTRSCYEFASQKGASFAEARDSCKGHGGDLLHDYDALTQNFLLSELDRRKDTLKTQLVWIGVQKEPGISDSTWKWVNNATVSRPAWGKDQPNNYNGEQNCAVLDGGRGWLWNDVGCNLDYLHWICQYLPSKCGSPDRNPMIQLISGSSGEMKEGSTTQYACPDGHMLLGESLRTCKHGEWTGKAPSCKFIECGSPPTLDHGTVSLVDKRTTYNATAVYTCHENYTLVGTERRQCDGDGTWGGGSDGTMLEAPRCLLHWCPAPPKVEGSTTSISLKDVAHKARSEVKYDCQKGYTLFGDATIKCELGGKWSEPFPVCKWVECPPPTSPVHGNATLVTSGLPTKSGGTMDGSKDALNSPVPYGGVVKYACEADYWLVGESEAVCTREGVWSASTPSCELITCLEPDVPAGGYVVGYDFNVHSTIQYHCEVGYARRGPAEAECKPDGEWSRPEPQCEYIECGRVTELISGRVNYLNGTTHLGSEIEYTCSPGHRLRGSKRRYCLDNARWSDAEPKCEEIRCPEPTIAKHSIVSVTGNDRMYGRTLIRTSESSSGSSAGTYRVGAVAKYRCERGHTLQGEALSTCEESGHWSGDVPNCHFVDCGSAPSIVNGRVTLASNASYYGAAALYECDNNFKLVGVSRRLCMENATWSGDAPKCEEVTCPEPELLDGASVTLVGLTVGSVVVYNCPKGSTPLTNLTRTCNELGKWTGKPARCKLVECPLPEDIEFGRVVLVNSSRTYGASAEHHCAPGRRREGPYLRRCREDGTWSGSTPKCEVAADETTQDGGTLGLAIGIASGILLFILLLMGLIYMRLRKARPVKNTENIEGAERKEDANAAVVSYATLTDGQTNHHQGTYDISDGLYDAPYASVRGSGLSSTHGYPQSAQYHGYEPEPRRPHAVTVNGVAVR